MTRSDEKYTTYPLAFSHLPTQPNAYIPQVPLTPSLTAENATSALRSNSPLTLPNPFADSAPESPDSGIHATLPCASVSTISNLPLSLSQRSRQSTLISTPSEALPIAPSHAPPYVNVFALSPNMGLNHINQSGTSRNIANEDQRIPRRSPNAQSEASLSASSWTDGEAAPSESGESHLAFSIGSYDDIAAGDGRPSHAHLNENISDSSSPSHHSISDLEHMPSSGGPHVIFDWESVSSPSASEDGR